jgi:D-alanyl-D-alanine dipeptidase
LKSEGFHGVFLFAPNMSTDNREKLNAVNPLLREKALKILSLAAADGFQLTVTQAVRTFAEQDALFAQGRTRKGPIVTNARGGQSWHNFGMAVDLAFVVDGKISWDDKLYSKIGKWASVAGLDWGGDWKKFKDLPQSGPREKSGRKAGQPNRPMPRLAIQTPTCLVVAVDGGRNPRIAGPGNLGDQLET